jgi:hypothetical protein
MIGQNVTVEKQNVLKPWVECIEKAADALYLRNEVIIDRRLAQAMADVAVAQCSYPMVEVRHVIDPSPGKIGSSSRALRLERADIARERKRIRRTIERRSWADAVEGT